jgi:nucleotide-binding universal stress UspA family protein
VTLTAVAPLQPGDELDGFRIEERIHAGGQGVLYRVSAAGAAGPLLMKVPRLGQGEPASSVISFEVESMVLAALQGPHVPRLVAAGDLARRPYLVMELVEGTSLADRAAEAPLPPEEVARLGVALATAVHALHLQEAIHLDLKPGNVIVRPSGEAVLVDFGLARHGHLPDLLAEEFRRAIGSAPYISPEQVLGVRDDPRSDLFAIGVILYELATGELPFGSPTTTGGLRRRLYRDPTPPRAIRPEIPPELQEVILRCLEPEAGRRHGSAAHLAFDLAHPQAVEVGERGRRTRRAGPLTVMRRWIRAAGREPAPFTRPSVHLAGAGIVLVAVATAHGDEAQHEALRREVKRLVAHERTRVACVTVIRPAPELGGSSEEEAATAQRIKHLVLLRQWAEPMALAPHQVTFHAVESDHPADALLEYARANAVDHVVVGAPPPDMPFRGLLGTVATKVALEAPCTVTIVRRPRGA